MRASNSTIIAWAALILALAAAFAVWREDNRSRFSQGVALVLKMEDSFDGDRMQQARQDAAKGILGKQYASADPVLDFFDTLGMLVHRGAVDEELVWQSFYYPIHGYWQAAQKRIVQEQSQNPGTWKELARLHAELVAIDNRRHHRPASDRDVWEDQNLRGFLDDESSLLEDSNDSETANSPPLLRNPGRSNL